MGLRPEVMVGKTGEGQKGGGAETLNADRGATRGRIA
jgi:hypothetical protein